MSMDNSIFTRRSVRRFEDRPVKPEQIERILRAGMQAPTARGLQPWELLVTVKPETKQAVSTMSPYAGLAKDAAALIIACANLERTQPDCPRWDQDLAACTQNMLLQITEEGLGGVWLGLFPDDHRIRYIREIFHIPNTVVPYSVIALGYGLEKNCYVDRFDPKKVHYETY